MGDSILKQKIQCTNLTGEMVCAVNILKTYIQQNNIKDLTFNARNKCIHYHFIQK